MSECMTKPLLTEFSGCLVENPSCGFAVRFGFSYLCEHPRHKDFSLERSPVDRNKLYNDLKISRRTEYLSMAKRFLADMEAGTP
ncbi:hypothetical protein GSbR_12980 [Geobacter sp. SVR]|nr:hypothetical protein GSVR_42430 [Geobacter sp. SVR]GCF84698.1 hypothetical protein GSbR_12980 [Geobacter sp. SVR]